MSNPSLSNAEIVALGTAVKEKQLGTAKAALKEGSSETVDFSVRITGSVQKGQGTPGTAYEVKPIVTLDARFPFYALLRQLGIGAKRLKAALAALPPVNQIELDQEFEQLFAEASAAQAAKLPTTHGVSARKAGAVQSQVAVEKLAK